MLSNAASPRWDTGAGVGDLVDGVGEILQGVVAPITDQLPQAP